MSRDINRHLSPNADFYISGVCQKVSIPHPALCIAFAGSALQARFVSAALTEAVEAGADHPESLVEAILSLDEDYRNEVAVMATLAQRDPVAGPSGWRLSHIATDNCQTATVAGMRFYVGGSGTNTFLQILPQVMAFAPNSQPPRREFQVGHALQGFLAGLEFTGRGSFDEYWGGAFELAHLTDDGFRKIGNMMLAAGELSQDDNGHPFLSLYRRLVAYRYVDHGLLISTLDFDEASGAAARRTLIPPLVGRGTAAQAADWPLDFTHDTLSCVISGGDVLPGWYHHIHRFRPPQPLVEVNVEHNSVHINIRQTLIDEIREVVHQISHIQLS